MRLPERPGGPRGGLSDYPLETRVVYNGALDDVTSDSVIKYIIVGDNPGREEQLAKNRRYLVGQSGRLARGFFARHAALGADFGRNVIVLNKTPVHTRKTAELASFLKAGGAAADLLVQTQTYMAELAYNLHKALSLPGGGAGAGAGGAGGAGGERAELWIVGYSELRKNGIFAAFRERLSELYAHSPLWDDVYVFQHFSMNRFTIDLNAYQKETALPLREALRGLGKRHRDRVFGD